MHQYERIARALDQYRVLAAKDDGELLPATEEAVEPGEDYDGTPRLIRLLSLVGDLSEGALPAGSGWYEGELVTAVKRFQSRHGLEPDGRIDQTTLDQLDTSLRDRFAHWNWPWSVGAAAPTTRAVRRSC